MKMKFAIINQQIVKVIYFVRKKNSDSKQTYTHIFGYIWTPLKMTSKNRNYIPLAQDTPILMLYQVNRSMCS